MNRDYSQRGDSDDDDDDVGLYIHICTYNADNVDEVHYTV